MTAPQPPAGRRPPSDLQPHPHADVIPGLTGQELAALHADITAHGLRVPLEITADGLVLDGRARLQIARQLNLAQLPVVVIDPAEPVAHMLRAALHRQHLARTHVLISL